MWNDPSLKDLRDLLAASAPVDRLEKDLGIAIGDIETVTVLWPSFRADDFKPGPGGFVVRTKEPYDKTGLLTKMKAAAPQDARNRRSYVSSAMARSSSFIRPVTSAMSVTRKDKMPLPSSKDGETGVPEGKSGTSKDTPVTRKELPPATSGDHREYDARQNHRRGF